jgi:hypothetical protein
MKELEIKSLDKFMQNYPNDWERHRRIVGKQRIPEQMGPQNSKRKRIK